ncbi:MAG: hypothetical protein KAI74_01900 [Kiritimatiellae bacterium]|nr:hypothetical protein [Kiritimatiellia bacterium]
MTKKVLWALILIFVVVIILLMNTRGSSEINLIVGEIKAMSSIIYLCFVGIGVAIGVLLK